MAETLILDRSITRHLSKIEITRQLLQDSIVSMEFHFEKALTDKNQKVAEIILEMLIKTRRMLRELPVKASQS